MCKKMFLIFYIVVMNITGLIGVKNNVSQKVLNKLKRGWQHLSIHKCPEGIIKTYANKGWLIFMRDMAFTKEGEFIENLASDLGLADAVQYCNVIWPMKVENFKYTGKIFLFIKKDVIKEFKEYSMFELPLEKPLDQIIIQ